MNNGKSSKIFYYFVKQYHNVKGIYTYYDYSISIFQIMSKDSNIKEWENYILNIWLTIGYGDENINTNAGK